MHPTTCIGEAQERSTKRLYTQARVVHSADASVNSHQTRCRCQDALSCRHGGPSRPSLPLILDTAADPVPSDSQSPVHGGPSRRPLTVSMHQCSRYINIDCIDSRLTADPARPPAYSSPSLRHGSDSDSPSRRVRTCPPARSESASRSRWRTWSSPPAARTV
jgi:hypothetical protein